MSWEGDDETQCERGRKEGGKTKVGETAGSARPDRGRERNAEREICADVICGGVRERKGGSVMALDR